jgi:hypothetical protein
MSKYEEPLEFGLLADITQSKQIYERQLQFQWEFFSELAYQRNRIYDSLKSSLRNRAGPFAFSTWQRAVKYKYALAPLSTNGSVMDPGGRFNIGAIDPTRYPVFPALYLGSEKGTALSELLGRDSATTSLTAEESALANPASVAVVSVSGKLEAVLDVRDESNLIGFVDLIKGFRFSTALSSKAKNLGFAPLKLVRTTEGLAAELVRTDWRTSPMLFDVPAPCQIFGRIALDAEIEGILYDSVLTAKPCLVVFHQNFRNSTSYVELDEPVPFEVVQRRLDATNWRDSVRA